MQRLIEALESRIAPAAVFTYTEADGDLIKVSTTAKVSNAYFESLATFSAETGNRDLTQLRLDDSAFRNTSLTITVVQAGGGNGKASIGYIDAEVDLKNVIIDGDLAAINVGDSNQATVGLSKLQVNNLGVGGGYGDSNLRSGAKSIKILGDLIGDIYAGGFEEGNFGTLNSITIVGSVGEDADISARKIGTLAVGGNMGGQIEARVIKSVRIGGDLVGTYEETGEIYADSIKSVRITGSILGGDAYSAGIWADFIGTVTVGGDIVGGAGEHSGYIYGDDEIGKVIVYGSVIGGSGDMSGIIESEGDVGVIRVGGDLVSGAGELSGSIALVYHDFYFDEYYGYGELYFEAYGHAEKITIGGSLIGEVEVGEGSGNSVIISGDFGGSIVASSIGNLRIGGDVRGGAAHSSGSIFGDFLSSAYIAGNLIGGGGEYSGSIDFTGLGNIRVLESVIGGDGASSASILAYIGIGSVSIGGNVQGGDSSGSGSIGTLQGSIDSIAIRGSLSNSLASLEDGTNGIYAGGSIGRVTIGGGVTGAGNGTLGIRAGYDHPGNSWVPSIESISIKGDVTNFLIEAGVSFFGEVNPSATIGSVSITGSFTASSIAAGVGAGEDGFYGTHDDILSSDPSVVSRIASVVIGGAAAGTPSGVNSLDGYGVFAQHIVAAKINGTKVTLRSGASNDLVAALYGGTGDFRLVELPAPVPGN